MTGGEGTDMDAMDEIEALRALSPGRGPTADEHARIVTAVDGRLGRTGKAGEAAAPAEADAFAVVPDRVRARRRSPALIAAVALLALFLGVAVTMAARTTGPAPAAPGTAPAGTTPPSLPPTSRPPSDPATFAGLRSLAESAGRAEAGAAGIDGLELTGFTVRRRLPLQAGDLDAVGNPVTEADVEARAGVPPSHVIETTFRTGAGTTVAVRAFPAWGVDRWENDIDPALLVARYGRGRPPVAGVAVPDTLVWAGEYGGRTELSVVRGGRRPVFLLVTLQGGPPIDTVTLARFGAGLAAHGGEDLLTMAAAVPCGEVVCGP
jgi:hypothetical protein